MKNYQNRSPVGRFKPQANGRWGLWFKDDLLGSYHSAMAAPDDVYMQAPAIMTGTPWMALIFQRTFLNGKWQRDEEK